MRIEITDNQAKRLLTALDEKVRECQGYAEMSREYADTLDSICPYLLQVKTHYEACDYYTACANELQGVINIINAAYDRDKQRT